MNLRLFRTSVLLLAGLMTLSNLSYADTGAAVTGQVTDPHGLNVAGVAIQLTNLNTNITYKAESNEAGIYRLGSLPPGIYRANVTKDGFKSIVKSNIELHVQDVVSINFSLQLGSVNESITVESGTPLINTESAAVSTVVDRQFAENLPLNGRSFQTLIELTPGVVVTPSSELDSGQFSVNGQRAASNYWMVDGVGANIGVGAIFNPHNGLGGALPSFSVQGGTNSLVSVDALQEFRIQTSTYAPEFGRTPGAQISIVTRSGTNQFHGTVFDYLRNDAIDANNWFNGFCTPGPKCPLPKAKERQNDFGGTFSGPLVKDRTFFFFSYEGLRLRLPQTTLTTVPDLPARQAAAAAVQPFLNAYPQPNGTDLGNGIAQFDASYSNPSTLDAYSLRIDEKLSDRISLFGRYNYSPSKLDQRGLGTTYALSIVFPARITLQTGTVGATWSISSATVNDLRFNYSRTNAHSTPRQDGFGGAVPLTTLPLPSPFTSQDANVQVFIFSLVNSALVVGQNLTNIQRQINIVDNLSLQRGSHNFKFGLDFRRLSPTYDPAAYNQFNFFSDVPSAQAGTLAFGFVQALRSVHLLFKNLGAFVQDTWRLSPRVNVTYGLRWDVEFAPSSLEGPSFVAVTGYDLSNLSNLALAPAGTPPFKTQYGSLAPRIGLAYQLTRNPDWQSVIRGGFGVFYDLATSEIGGAISSQYPFGSTKFIAGGSSFPLDPASAAPAPFAASSLSSGVFNGFDPNLKLPYTLQWNVALEQALGKQQTISASYVGAAGRRLIQSAFVLSPNPSFGAAVLVGNTATSGYNALQLQFVRRLSRGLEALAGYTWSHSIDTASAGSVFGNEANALVAGLNPNVNRGSSDFDIRNAFTAGLTYSVPSTSPRSNGFQNAILRGWSIQNIVQVRSAPPVNVYESGFFALSNSLARVRPDVVPGQPFYLFGAQYPGGKAFNPGAFTNPPTDAMGNPLREGNLGRNALRGFGATQWDFAVHRDFPIHESVKLQFRAEMFNVLNHPNFAQPSGALGTGGFGLSSQTLAQSLSGGNVGGGAFSPLYQIGGPRSIQFGLKLSF